MKVYFGASITYSRDLLPQYQRIVKKIEGLGHTVVSKYVVDPKLKVGLGLSPTDLYKKETSSVEKSDVMVAEVTAPSWGTSFLISHAVTNNIPVLALHYKGEENALPLMVKGHPQLYFESYTEENIDYVLKIFFEHYKTTQKRKGKLIVIEGSDGSGKKTQANLLLEYFRQNKTPVKYVDFPRYYTSFHGKVIGRYLKGEFGSMDNTSPYLIALAYAVDRAGVRQEINDFLEKGGVIIANRYATSNKAFMAAKFKDPKKQQEFIHWVDELEYKVHKIPREDMVIYLHVPLSISQKLIEKRGKRQYSGKSKDLHEENIEYMVRVEKIYEKLVAENKNWIKIECTKNGELLPKEEIHKKILKILFP